MAASDDMQGMDHSLMNHSQMQGMDDNQMQTMDEGQMQPAAPSESRTPIPVLTDADRAAVYADPAGHHVHDSTLNSFFLADKLEWQDADDGSTLAWICPVGSAATLIACGCAPKANAPTA